MAIIESAGITDVGKKRKGNEDSLFLDDDQRLYVVADGMGGHQAGEVASKLVVETIRDYMKRFKDEGEAEELDDSDETLSREANRLLSSINLANNVVYNVSQTKNTYSGMGATVSAVYFTDETLISANVGDSPIYLVHNGNIELLSTTHNVFSEQAALDPEMAMQIGAEFKHMLTRAMGIEETVKADICEIQYFKGDALVISSDGLSDKVSPEEILDIVSNVRSDKACRSLVDLANKRGGDDNITVIALKIKDVKNNKTGFAGIISQILYSLKKLFK
ncbi:MAG: protein phosphatase 2C domain-containing protein [Thermodesulfobacteriota bacterium]|nr:protein phosphatase 2C domain-containing protein [Thermodesulfobacteriota bacterium]